MQVDPLATRHSPLVTSPGWRAELELGFARSGSKTILARRRHVGPLTVQRPFYPEGGVCHVYLLHPPGGVVAGDELAFRVAAETGAEALVTTPAAGKFYRSDGPLARQAVTLDVGAGAALEWLPQETIVYAGAQVVSDLRVELKTGARFIGWEILALGRPASGERFETGAARLDWRIDLDGQPLYLERQQWDAQACAANWGLRGRAACGTLFAWPASERALEAVRALIGEDLDRGVTLIDGLLVCRALDPRADWLRQFFLRVWETLRPEIVGRLACPPRIWAT
jgi:urease accessory protein